MAFVRFHRPVVTRVSEQVFIDHRLGQEHPGILTMVTFASIIRGCYRVISESDYEVCVYLPIRPSFRPIAISRGLGTHLSPHVSSLRRED